MIPAHIAETLVDLRARRTFLDQAISVLSQIWEGEAEHEPAPKPRKPYARKVKAETEPPTRRAKRVNDQESPAQVTERRDSLLTLIRKSEVGLTLGELRHHTPKMDGKHRSTALQALKAQGAIRRAGNSWVAA